MPARRPAARGQRLVMTGLNQERLSALAAETGSVTFTLEARESAAMKAFFQSIIIDLLLHETLQPALNRNAIAAFLASCPTNKDELV